MSEHLSDAFEYFFYTYGFANMKTNYRRETAEEEAERLEKKRQKDLPQFLKPGYKIISDPNPISLNFWDTIFNAIEMETVQIEQNE